MGPMAAGSRPTSALAEGTPGHIECQDSTISRHAAWAIVVATLPGRPVRAHQRHTSRTPTPRR